MKKTYYYCFIFLPLIGCFGAWLNGFWGGCIAGAALVLAIIFFAGRWQVKRMEAMMDKKLTDKKLYENDESDFD